MLLEQKHCNDGRQFEHQVQYVVKRKHVIKQVCITVVVLG